MTDGLEADYGPPIPAIGSFLERKSSRVQAESFDKRVGNCPAPTLRRS